MPIMSAPIVTDSTPALGPSRRNLLKRGSLGAVALGGLMPMLAACSEDEESPADGKRVRMLSTSYGNVIPWTTQGYTSQKYWAERFNVDLQQLDPGADPAKQLDQLDNALSQKWDVAVINSIVQGNVTTAVQKLIDAGTIVIGYLGDVALEDKPLDGLLTTVQADNYRMGFDMTTALCNELGGSGTIIETQGISGGDNVVDRHRGFEDALKAFPNIEVLASDYGEFTKARAQDLWSTYITKYPRIDAAFCHNDDMALGAANALNEANRAGDTLLAGVDGTIESCRAVMDGTLFATVRHSASQVYGWPIMLGALSFQGKLEGDIPEIITVDSPVVDKDRAPSIIFTQSDAVNLQ